MGGELFTPVRRWPVRARSPLTQERIIDEVDAPSGDPQAALACRMHERMKTRTRLYARQLRDMATFFHYDPDAQGALDEADIAAMKIAVGLRTSTFRAGAMIRDAHRAVEQMPRTFHRLAAGELPEEWHVHLLRLVRPLDEGHVQHIDEHLDTWDLASISRDQFVRHLRRLIAMVTALDAPKPPSALRSVDLHLADPELGTASLTITGPIPEIVALSHRLDVCAHAVQKAQRAALQDENGTEIPFDIDGDVLERGRPLSLAAIRYAILTRSVLETGTVQVPVPRFKLYVTVPALTLQGRSEMPGMLNGLVPVPADQARALAGGESTWFRILTDPATGAYLPTAPTTYRPPAALLEQLRFRHPTCNAPGCTRPTILASEADHIIEFNHRDPRGGGPTSLENLHLMCWLHHKWKTMGRLDPVRDDADLHNSWASDMAGTVWTIDGKFITTTWDDRDLVAPQLGAEMNEQWREHQGRHGYQQRPRGDTSGAGDDDPAGSGHAISPSAARKDLSAADDLTGSENRISQYGDPPF